MDQREAYILLNMMEGVGPVSVRNLTAALGAPEAILQAPAGALTAVPGIGPGLAEKILRQRDTLDAQHEIRRAADMGGRLITPADGEYPDPLRQIHDPPLALYVMGTLQPGDRHAIAVVGTRHATVYGRETATRLSDRLARAGWTVVSGLARGIDTFAHTAALNAGGRSVAVLGGALDHIYPAENSDLARRLAQQGAVLSEFPLGRKPDRTTFPMRNRIVSGLVRAVLVVEAGRKSGALITANQALEQGRSVMAVPGRVDSPASRGTHHLLKNGARLVEDLDDILEEFEFLVPSAEPPPTPPPEVDLTAEQRAVLHALREEEQDFDALIRATGIAAARMNVLLLQMEMRRQIRVLPGRLVALVRRDGADRP